MLKVLTEVQCCFPHSDLNLQANEGFKVWAFGNGLTCYNVEHGVASPPMLTHQVV